MFDNVIFTIFLILAAFLGFGLWFFSAPSWVTFLVCSITFGWGYYLGVRDVP